MKTSQDSSSLYNFFHKKYKKLMGNVQKKENTQNPYNLKKLVGKHLYESSDDIKVDTLPFTEIEGTDLTRVKEDKSSYAIGDKDGNPITDFDFVYVSTEVRGDETKKIEVITKEGESRFFDIDNKILLECGGGMGVGGVGMGAADGGGCASNGGGLPTGDSISTDVVGPKVGPDGTVTPMSAIGGCRGKKKCQCDRRIPRGVGLYFGVAPTKRKKRRRKQRKI